MVRKYALIEKFALIRERFMAPPTFLGLPVHDRDVLLQTHHGDYPYHLSLSKWKRNWKSRIRETLEV